MQMTRVRVGSWNGSPNVATSVPRSLSLADESEPVNDGVAARQVARERLGHLVSGRHQAVNRLAMERHLADCEYALVARAKAIVDDDTAARTDVDAGGARDLVSGTDAGGDDRPCRRRALRRSRTRCR